MPTDRDMDMMDRERRLQEEEENKRLGDPSFKGNPNDRLISHELSTLRKLKTQEYKDSGTIDPLESRFNVLGSTKDISRIKNIPKSKNEKGKRESADPKTAGIGTNIGGIPNFKSRQSTNKMNFALKKKDDDKKQSGKGEKLDRMNAENYRTVYLRRQRLALQGGKNLTSDQAKQKAAAEKKQQEQETLLRVRARDLYDQILWWRTQYGMGVYENYYIGGELARLEQEINSIDARFWP
jgi:hypothetical protein